MPPKKEFRAEERIDGNKNRGSHANFLEVEGSPDLLIRETSVSEWGLDKYARMQELLDEMRGYFPVIRSELLSAEGETTIKVQVEKVYGKNLEEVPLDAGTAEAMDKFFSSYIRYALSKMRELRTEFSEELNVDSFMYGHRVDPEGNTLEEDRVILVDIDPIISNKKQTLLSMGGGMIEDMESKANTAVSAGISGISMPHSFEALEELRTVLSNAILKTADKKAVILLEIARERAANLINVLERLNEKR